MADEQIQVRLFLTAKQIALLASCAEIGLEGAGESHANGNGDNQTADLQAVDEAIDHMKEMASFATLDAAMVTTGDLNHDADDNRPSTREIPKAPSLTEFPDLPGVAFEVKGD